MYLRPLSLLMKCCCNILTLIIFAATTLWVSISADFAATDDGGWRLQDDSFLSIDADGICNIERHVADDLSDDEFIKRYAYYEPVIITYSKKNAKFKMLSRKPNLLAEYGDRTVILSTANTYSYTKVVTLVKTKFREYIKNFMKPQRPDTLGNESFYLFGDIDKDEWQTLFEKYELPPYSLPDLVPELSFGVAGAGTGVPFHFHGPGFGEVIYGRKRWFLYPFEKKPEFDPDQSTLQWFLKSYPRLSSQQKPLECTLHPNEVIYFPDRWWHSTLNLENTVFISTFFGPMRASVENTNHTHN